jgi:hypothetical protein
MAVECENIGISAQELKNSLLAKVTATGVIGLRVKRVSAAAAGIEPVIGCAEFNIGDEQLLRMAVGLSTSGEPALILIEES